MYRNNINDLINRFEVTNDDDFDMSENVKYVRQQQQPSSLSHIRKYTVQSGDESFGNDENRSLMKYNMNDKFFDRGIFIQRKNVSFTGAKEFIKQLLQKISMLLEMISKFPFPRMSVMSFGLTSLLAVFIAPRSFTDKALYPGFKILFTIVYPAYRSFKAVRNKNLKEYLKWIVYWIVFAFFTILELVTDALLPWFPFYNEIKVIILIWLLGPSSRGSMKVYKNIVHPMLISREQEIDNVIQLAQEHGYMQVFKLSSKSVNYANKIIMQDAKTDSSFIVSHQLMKNVSLSNISDAGTIQSNDDSEETLRMRRYSLDKVPIYGSNYSYEQRRKPSFDYRYDEMMSSGYASPTSSLYRSQHRAYIEENVGVDGNDLSRKYSMDSIPRRASITELSDDEIILAYHKLQKQKQPPTPVATTEVHDDKNYKEFLKWMKMKRNDDDDDEKTASMTTIKENIVLSQRPPLKLPQAFPLNVDNEEKVNTIVINDDDAINVVKDDEKEVAKEIVNVSVPLLLESESDPDEDDDFKDAISDEDERDYLNVPLIIQEESDDNDVKVIEETVNLPETEVNLTLSNDAILTSSNMSLTSTNEKRPARHSKGKAPPPPPSQEASTSNVIEGFYYDELMKKHFKETEL